MASLHSHQLGLHQTAESTYLSDKEKILSQRLYDTTRAFDAYITSSLGLPPNFRAVEASCKLTKAPYLNDNATLEVASANVELLEVMSSAREKMFFSDAAAQVKGSNIIALEQLDNLSKTFDQWASKHAVSRQTPVDGNPNCTKSVQFQKPALICLHSLTSLEIGHPCSSSTHSALSFSSFTAQSSTTSSNHVGAGSQGRTHMGASVWMLPSKRSASPGDWKTKGCYMRRTL